MAWHDLSGLKRPIVVLVAIVVLTPAVISAAVSGGGTTIANAPTITSGERVFGNTASEPVAESDNQRFQWWRLVLKTANKAEISSENPEAARYFKVLVYPASATDATVYRSDSSDDWVATSGEVERQSAGPSGASVALLREERAGADVRLWAGSTSGRLSVIARPTDVASMHWSADGRAVIVAEKPSRRATGALVSISYPEGRWQKLVDGRKDFVPLEPQGFRSQRAGLSRKGFVPL